MHRTLFGAGSALIFVSLLIALFLSAVDPLWASGHLTTYAVLAWAQQAGLVLGSAVVAAGLVVVRLAPAPPKLGDERAAGSPPSDWFS